MQAPCPCLVSTTSTWEPHAHIHVNIHVHVLLNLHVHVHVHLSDQLCTWAKAHRFFCNSNRSIYKIHKINALYTFSPIQYMLGTCYVHVHMHVHVHVHIQRTYILVHVPREEVVAVVALKDDSSTRWAPVPVAGVAPVPLSPPALSAISLPPPAPSGPREGGQIQPEGTS